MMIPMLFNTEMVQAIMDGRKTQTRRIIKPQPVWDGISCFHISKYGCWKEGRNDRIFSDEDNWPINTGDILWVRETWDNISVSPGGHLRFGGMYYYRADGDFRPEGWQGNWHPSIHMPKEAARIFLRVKDVRIERLHDISVIDAINEGCSGTICDHEGAHPTLGCTDCLNTGWLEAPDMEFSQLWDTTIKPEDRDRFGWDANPWVWVIEFERCAKPEGWCV